jgi:hypothetical protein
MRILFFLFILILGASCEKVIDVELDEGDVLLVVDGWITNQPPPYDINLSTTAPYFLNQTTPRATGATVKLKDSEGNEETLTEVSAGKYRVNQIAGKVGNRYTLSIQYQGESYEAQTELKNVPPIDSLLYEKIPERLGRKEGLYINYFGPELASEGDFYRLKVFRNDTLFNKPADLVLFFDQFVNGNYLSDLEVNPFEPYKVNDKVRVELWSITEDAYNFYNEMVQQINNGGLFATPPANVRTNVKNVNPQRKKAVGYFGGAGVSYIQGTLTSEKGKILP